MRRSRTTATQHKSRHQGIRLASYRTSWSFKPYSPCLVYLKSSLWCFLVPAELRYPSARDQTLCRSSMLQSRKVQLLPLLTKVLLAERTWVSGLMMGYALTSIVCGVFDVKHYLHLQVRDFLFTQGLSDNVIISSARSTYFAPSSGNDMFPRVGEPNTLTPTTQYWRLAAHHVAFSSSSDLLLSELLLYGVGINIERQFGSVKFAVGTLLKWRCSELTTVLTASLLPSFPH